MRDNQNISIHPLLLIIVVFVSLLLNSCELIEGIFKTGMGFGIFLVIAVIGVIIIIISRLGKK